MPSEGFKLIALLLAAAIFLAPLASAQNASANSSAALNASVNSSGSASAAATPKPLSASDVAAYFAKQGETTEAKGFAYNGGTYYMVLVNGKESVILDPSLNALTADADIRKAVAAYSSTLTLPFKQSNLDAVSGDYTKLKASFDYCGQVYYNFTSGIRFCFVLVAGKSWTCSAAYDLDLGAFLNASSTFSISRDKSQIKSGNAQMNASLQSMAAAIADLNANFAQAGGQGIASKLQAVSAAAANFSTGFDNFSAGYNDLKTVKEFAGDGGLSRCAIDKSSLIDIQTSTGVASSIQTPEAMAAQVVAFTQSRAATAASAKTAAALNAELTAFGRQLDAFKAGFAAVNNLDPSYLNAAFKELTALAAQVASSNNSDAAAAQFNAKFSTAQKVLDSSTAALDFYAKSNVAISNSSRLLAEDYKKFGTSDARLQKADSELKAIKSTFELKEQDMRQGRPATKEDFQAINANATSLNTRLASMGRPENELDFVTIGGALLVILAIGGIVFYLRKLKAKQGL